MRTRLVVEAVLVSVVALGLVLPGGMALNFLLKIAFHRHRPSFEDLFLIFSGYNFPSGHTLAATLLYGLLAVCTAIALETWRWRVGAVLGAIFMILLVGFSRVCLGAHYLSDVLGAAPPKVGLAGVVSHRGGHLTSKPGSLALSLCYKTT